MMSDVHFADLASRIGTLALAAERPLIVSDADEVVFAFMHAFEGFLIESGYRFDWSSFRLTGNVLPAGGGAPADQATVGALLEEFYRGHAGRIAPVPGAAEQLRRLSARAQVVILTNAPDSSRDARARSLAAHGMPYPVLINRGRKGRAVATLGARVCGPVFFLDDSPGHLESVAAHAPDVRRIHFVHHPCLAALVAPAPACHHRTDDWKAAYAVIDRELAAAGY